MAKAIKLPDGYYWDSSSVSHDKETLNQIINANIGKSVRLVRRQDQGYSANTEFVVSWQEEYLNNTNGVLVKDGNNIKCVKGNHLVMVSSWVQFIHSGNAMNYIYVIKNSASNSPERIGTTSMYGNPVMTTMFYIQEGDTISISAYSSLVGRLGQGADWSGFCVTLLS